MNGLESSKHDSSLKRHTALIKRMRQSMGGDNRDQIFKDIDSLSLEKYIDEIAGAVVEGVTRCKTEKDVWSAVEVYLWLSRLHRRTHSNLPSGYLFLTPSVFQNIHTSPRVLPFLRLKPSCSSCTSRPGARAT